MAHTVGRNDPCPCGSGRKFKHCCLQKQAAQEAAAVRVRSAGDRIADAVLAFAGERWGDALIQHAWEAFWNHEDVPDAPAEISETEVMFIPWFLFGHVPIPQPAAGADPGQADVDPDWPSRPIALEWLDAAGADVPPLDRAYVEAACRSPLSVFAVEAVVPGQSLDVKDVLTGARFHVVERLGSRTLKPSDLLFASVLSVGGVSLVLGSGPIVIPPDWHTVIIDWRQDLVRNRLMTREELARHAAGIRALYFDIAAELQDPTPPRLANTDGDPLALTTMTYEVGVGVEDALERLAPLAVLRGEEHVEIERDVSGAVTGATLTWMKAGNPKHKEWDNTVLGTLRLEPGRLVADVNSERRADRLKREIARRMGKRAVLADTTVVDPSAELAHRARARAAGEPTDDAEPPVEVPPELRAIQEEMLRRQWEVWLDTKVPALGHKTPRQAARTRLGRERVEALLAAFERHADEGSATTREHLARIREALGV
jgi:hypothetical protein